MQDLHSILPPKAASAFSDTFGHTASLCAVAPGRLNLIGEHTDYNEGFVFPVAIDRWTAALFSLRKDDRFVCHSMNTDERVDIALGDLDGYRNKGWFSYIAGVTSLLSRDGISVKGTNCVVSSTVPIGAGMSSSAALEISVAFGLMALAGRSIPMDRTIRLCQKAEREWAGVSCGIMDQFISARGSSHTALLIDCRSLSHQPIPVDPSLVLTVCDTNVPHTLASSEYNIRRQQCEKVTETIRQDHSDISSLRDVSMEMVRSYGGLLGDTLSRRARHVISENARVLAASDALWYKDSRSLGSLMDRSHESLRSDYEVSCKELDLMANICRSVPGVYGARMVGAGFGGSVLAISETDISDELKAILPDTYTKQTGIEPTVLTCRTGPGVRVIRLS